MAENKFRFQLPSKKAQKILDGDVGASKKVPAEFIASTTASMPITKQAQFGSGGPNVMMSQPMFFSPLHTPQNFQTPYKRRESYNWCRHFYQNDAKVAAGIDFYCFTPDTPVLMYNGKQKSISSIRIGDKVRCHDGSVNKVVRKFEREAKEEIIKIYVAGILNGPLKASATHKILVERNDKIEYVKASEIKEGDYVLTPCGYRNRDNYTPQKRNPLGYLLGAYAAEGCEIPYEHTSYRGRHVIDKKGVKFNLNFNELDTFGKIIIDCISELYGDACITTTSYEERSVIVINAYGKSIADDLCGMCPGTSSDGSKRFAPHVLDSDPEFLCSVAAGFFDGDGNLSKNVGQQAVRSLL